MSKFNLHWQTVLAAIVFVAALFLLPLTGSATSETTTAILVVTAAAIVISALDFGPAGAWALLVPSHIAVFLLIGAIAGAEGSASWSFFLVLVTCWLLAWRVVTMLSGDGSKHSGGGFAGRILVPTLFGVWLLILWEAITRGAGVPFVLLPPPSAIGARILTAVPTLAADFRQTVLKAMLFGFVVGSGAGFVVAVLADRFRFLSNGLLPIGNLVSALPMIGIAPIMVIWFGFDWQSRRAGGGVLRHAGGGHGLPNLDRSGSDESRHGLGGNSPCSPCRVVVLWRNRTSRTRRDFLAPVLSLRRRGHNKGE